MLNRFVGAQDRHWVGMHMWKAPDTFMVIGMIGLVFSKDGLRSIPLLSREDPKPMRTKETSGRGK